MIANIPGNFRNTSDRLPGLLLGSLFLALVWTGNLLALDGPIADLSTAAAWHDGSSQTWFSNFPDGLYDGDPVTLGLANFADEAVNFTFLFGAPVAAIGVRTYWSSAPNGDPAYRWSFSCADSIADLDKQAGSFRALAVDIGASNKTWSEGAFAKTSCRVFRLNGFRINPVRYLHLNELEIVLDPSELRFAKSLFKPAGLSGDSAGRLVVADIDRNALIRLDEAAPFVEVLGEGVLNKPMDVAIDAKQRFVVADTGNNRVVRLTANGMLGSIIAASGNEAGQVQAPEGVSIDSDGRILIADTGHHRIMRVTASGLPDTTFGKQGMVGGPDPVIDNTGFNAPSGVSWDTHHNQILVSDTLNNRIQILDRNGTYLRTVDAVYRPHAVTAKADGTLYAVGDGVNYPPLSGSVRVIEPNAEFVTGHYVNGNVGVALLTGGVMQDDGGDIIATELGSGGLLRLSGPMPADIEGLTFEAGSDSFTVRYRTRIAVPTEVFWGETNLESTVMDPTPVTEHEITATGLKPDSTYIFSVPYPRSQDDQLVFLPPSKFRTEPANREMLNVMRLRSVGIIYTSGLDAEQIQRARRRLEIVEEYFFRHSRGRLHVDIEIVEVSRQYTGDDIDDYGGFKISSAQADLVTAGYIAADQIDELIVFYGGVPNLRGANRAGTNILFDRRVGYCYYVTAKPGVAVHEVSHTLDFIYDFSGYRAFGFNHGLWAIDSTQGSSFFVNGAIIRNIPTSTFATLIPPFERIIEASDKDGDGLVDDPKFPVSESSTGASSELMDSDLDGVNDLIETQAGTASGTNPMLVDSDGDGASQGADRVDRNPMLAIEGYVARATPTVDGVIDNGDGWTLVSDRLNFKNPYSWAMNTDPNHQQDTRVWVAWDSAALYLAMEFSNTSVQFDIDGNGNGWFAGYDNYRLQFDGHSLNRVAVSAADKDLMFAIDDSGQWSEIFDDSARWQDPPPAGLGLDRMIDPQDIDFARAPGPQGRMVVEIRIPANPRGQFEPAAGQEVKMYTSSRGDALWDEDKFIRLLLVDGLDTDGDGLWDLQESDLGSDPNSVDGDLDGLADTEELSRALDPMNADTDGDNIIDGIDFLPLDPFNLLADPAGVSATDGVFTDIVRISFDRVEGATVYRLFRCLNRGQTCGTPIGFSTGLSFDDPGAIAGTSFWYRVKACNPSGCSSFSNADEGFRRIEAPTSRIIQLSSHDGDAVADLMLRNKQTGRWLIDFMKFRLVRPNSGPTSIFADQDWQMMGSGDFGGNGRGDILLRHRINNRWWIFIMNGRNSTSGESSLTRDQDWQVTAVDDFDADGKDDILLRHRKTGRWQIVFMNFRLARPNSGPTAIFADQNWEMMGTGDFGGNGRADVLLRHRTLGKWWIFMMNGRNSTSGETKIIRDLDWQIEGIDDFDGDGKDDILLRNTITGRWQISFMNFRQVRPNSGPTSIFANLDWQMMASGDFVGNGRGDVLLRHEKLGKWWIFLMNGRNNTSGESKITRDMNWELAEREKSKSATPVTGSRLPGGQE